MTARRYRRRNHESKSESSLPETSPYDGADDDDALMPAGWWQRDLRVVVGILAIIALAAIALVTLWHLGHASEEIGAQPSAIQVIQIYAEGVFWSVTVIGMAVAVYIVSRVGD